MLMMNNFTNAHLCGGYGGALMILMLMMNNLRNDHLCGGYVEALMILMLMMNNFRDDHLCGGYGGVVGVASLRGIGNPSRAANPPAKVAQISDEYLTRQKIF